VIYLSGVPCGEDSLRQTIAQEDHDATSRWLHPDFLFGTPGERAFG
jgi:hypothetical protein